MFLFKPSFKTYLLSLIFLLSFSLNLGFCQEHSLESKYFVLYYYKDCDLTELAQKLNINYFLHPDVFSNESEDINSVISKTLDALYLEVSDILDIHLYSYHGKIRVYPNREEFKKNAFGNYRGRVPDVSCIYKHSDNTIYISFPDLTLGMFAHETAHTIISHYFVVPPPVKIQEVLAGYVEYSIRKATGTLPEKLNILK